LTILNKGNSFRFDIKTKVISRLYFAFVSILPFTTRENLVLRAGDRAGYRNRGLEQGQCRNYIGREQRWEQGQGAGARAVQEV